MILLDSDLLEIGKPSWRSTLAFHALGKIGAVFRAVNMILSGHLGILNVSLLSF